MKRLSLKQVSLLTLLSFFSLLLVDAYPLAAGQAGDGLSLIVKGEADYENGLFQDALTAFNQALSLVANTDDRERLLLDISLVHFALQDFDSCRDALRSLRLQNPERQIDASKFPQGFVELYGQVNRPLPAASAMPATLEEPNPAPAGAPAVLVKEQVPAASAAPAVFEKAQKEAKFKKKGKKFPWLWVILGVGVVATVILLLSKKKSAVNYALTVTLAAGVNGTPAAGAYTYKSGTKIDYSYRPGSGFDALEVKLDDNILAASGQITMDQDHVLTVTARNANYNYDTDVLGFSWIAVAAGDFQMGDNFGGGDSRERPVHTVNLTSYSIAKYEVTFSQYDAFCTETGRTLPSDAGRGRGNRPVINVTWNDAKAFCDWLAAKTGKNIHLATEAQWERAAAGTDQRLYPWGSAVPTCDLATFSGCGGGTKPVGSCPAGASAVGAMDMAGNAWEWVQDWFDEGYYQECKNQGTVKNPQGPASGVNRVQRSGSYTVKAVRLRCSFRDYNYQDYSSPALGFRIVWEQ